jgi:hypothetical protein
LADRQILDVEEVDALTEDLRLMVLLDAAPLAGVPASETFLQQKKFGFVCHRSLVRSTQPELGQTGAQGQGRILAGGAICRWIFAGRQQEESPPRFCQETHDLAVGGASHLCHSTRLAPRVGILL